jgi:hypothetical protein
LIVVDDKIFSVVEIFSLAAQDSEPNRVECANDHALSVLPKERVKALAHFLCRLICKGNGHYLLWAKSSSRNQMSDAMGQNPGFSASSTG